MTEQLLSQANSRLTYIDGMRGFTIILVVYTHILGYIVCQIDEPFNLITVQFRMPLFFFISIFLCIILIILYIFYLRRLLLESNC